MIFAFLKRSGLVLAFSLDEATGQITWEINSSHPDHPGMTSAMEDAVWHYRERLQLSLDNKYEGGFDPESVDEITDYEFDYIPAPKPDL